MKIHAGALTYKVTSYFQNSPEQGLFSDYNKLSQGQHFFLILTVSIMKKLIMVTFLHLLFCSSIYHRPKLIHVMTRAAVTHFNII